MTLERGFKVKPETSHFLEISVYLSV